MTREIETAESMSETSEAGKAAEDRATPTEMAAVHEWAKINAEKEQELSRQQRRAQERADEKRSAALSKMASNAEAVVLGEEEAGRRERARRMLFALVKREGRVRIPLRDLEAIGARDGLDVKVAGHDLVITYLEGRAR